MATLIKPSSMNRLAYIIQTFKPDFDYIPHPKAFVASRPAVRRTTTTKAKAGKKKLRKRANVWSPVVGTSGISRTLAIALHDNESSSIHSTRGRSLAKRIIEVGKPELTRESIPGKRKTKDKISERSGSLGD